MTGPHGHVVSRPDGMKARCGGPAMCETCKRELAELEAARRAGEIIGYKIAGQVYHPSDVTIIRRGR